MDIIKQLNSINIKDFKNINLSEIKDNIQKRPDILINIVVVLVAIFSSIYIFMANTKSRNTLRSEMRSLEEKLKIVEQSSVIQKEYDELLKNFPQSIPLYDFNEKISKFAVDNNIQIVSFSPSQSKKESYWTVENVSLNVSSPDYSNIVNFIKDVENSQYAIRIVSWSGSMADDSSSTARRRNRSYTAEENAETNIQSVIRIEAITLNL